MGHKKRQRKKFDTPGHPWEGARIIKEKTLMEKYGFKNKKEIWKMESTLRSFKRQAKSLIAGVTEQADKERKQLINKLVKLGLTKPGAKLDDILDLKTDDILERRLQTIVFKKGLAKSAGQARQFIIHGHISLDGEKVTTPSRLILRDEESKIGFLGKSPIAKADHPERKVDERVKQMIINKEKEEVKKAENRVGEIKKEIKVEDGKEGNETKAKVKA